MFMLSALLVLYSGYLLLFRRGKMANWSAVMKIYFYVVAPLAGLIVIWGIVAWLVTLDRLRQ